MRRKAYSLMAAVLAMAGTAQAATLYWDGGTTNIPGNGDGTSQGGAGTWNTTIQNWDAGVSPHVAWNNAANSNDTVFFGGSGGTVTLGGDISLGGMLFNKTSAGYIIDGKTLNFGAGGWITNQIDGGVGTAFTIKSAISGSPTVWAAAGTGGGPSYNWMNFAPTNGTVTLGKVTLGYTDGDGGDKGWLQLAGTTTGNSVSEILNPGPYGLLRQDSGEWTLGNANARNFNLYGGNMILTGTLANAIASVVDLQLNGGTLHYNNPAAVNPNTGSLDFLGGNLDNSSGAAITNSTYNPKIKISADFTFIGSLGAASDLNLGTGGVTLNATRTVTVSNALTTLTVGGVISGSGFGLTKAGAGTLKLTANNTYSGGTTISAGKLKIGNNGSSGSVAGDIVNNATLEFCRSDSFASTNVISGSGSVIQSGSGSLTLAGTNAYTGDTRVDAGTLVLTNAWLCDTSSVHVSTGAVLELNFPESDVIGYLYLGGMAKRPGVYGSFGSGDPFINGGGTLTVQYGPPAAGTVVTIR